MSERRAFTRDVDWLRDQYCNRLAPIDEIADSAGCSAANIRRLLKKWQLRRGREHLVPWNKGKTDPKGSASKRGENNPMFGRPAWNKGLKCPDISRSLSGKKASDEAKRKQSEAKRGKYGALANNWRGGITKSGGYYISADKKYAHRIIAERAFGRELPAGLHIHHKNRDRLNNDPRNLLIIGCRDHNALHVAMRKAIKAGVELNQTTWLKKNHRWFLEVHLELEKADQSNAA